MEFLKELWQKGYKNLVIFIFGAIISFGATKYYFENIQGTILSAKITELVTPKENEINSLNSKLTTLKIQNSSYAEKIVLLENKIKALDKSLIESNEVKAKNQELQAQSEADKIALNICKSNNSIQLKIKELENKKKGIIWQLNNEYGKKAGSKVVFGDFDPNPNKVKLLENELAIINERIVTLENKLQLLE